MSSSKTLLKILDGNVDSSMGCNCSSYNLKLLILQLLISPLFVTQSTAKHFAAVAAILLISH
jgi:hypothetical protein